VEIPYKDPYDWESMLSTFRSHQLPHLESVDDVGYERVIPVKKGLGWIRVTHNKNRSSLRVSVWNSGKEDSSDVNKTVRCMFDLDADPDMLRHVMTADPFIFSVWKRYPGLRVPRSWNGFETMLTTILGQVVSVSFGRTLADELMKACGTKAVHPKNGELIHLFPTAEQLVTADLTGVRTSESRRVTIRSLAKLALDGTLTREHPLPPAKLRTILLAIPGIGPWTAEYVAMRGFRDDDAFPATDYGLKQELNRHPEIDVDRVRPWRAYAATALWKSYAESKGKPIESLI
jgi:3-methyladenine DNA glycosylase/8-oxoguanine DNA glycosylase